MNRAAVILPLNLIVSKRAYYIIPFYLVAFASKYFINPEKGKRPEKGFKNSY